MPRILYIPYWERKCGRCHSQPFAWHEDEETAKSCGHNQEHDQHGNRAPVECFSHEWLPDLVEVEESVFAVSQQCDDGVKHILVSEDEVDGQREGKNNL